MQYKTLINPSFVVLQLELEELFKDGWSIDQDQLPYATMLYYSVSLVRDEHRATVKAAFKEEPSTIDFDTAKLPPEAPKRGPKPKQ